MAKHDKNTIQNSITAMLSHLNKFNDYGFLEKTSDNYNLKITPEHNIYTIKGELSCKGLIVIDVFKLLEVVDRKDNIDYVKTRYFKYNVHIRGKFEILRYDNSDHHIHHNTTFHKHEYNWNTGVEYMAECNCCPKYCLNENDFPHLGDVVDEMYQWWIEYNQLLQNPDDFPEVGLR